MCNLYGVLFLESGSVHLHKTDTVFFTKQEPESIQELEECRLKVSHILQSSLMSDGTRRFATPPQQIAAYNKRIQPTREEGADPSPPWVYSDKEYVVGDEV